MNCNPGDLAFIVKHDSEGPVDLGKIVQVVRLADGHDCPYWECDTLGQRFVVFEPDGEAVVSDGIETIDIPDEYLRPIRDNPGQDETLSWREVPRPLEAIPQQ